MWRFNLLYGLLLVFVMLGCSAGSTPTLHAKRYLIVIEKPDQYQWGNYLYRHLSKRTSNTAIVLLKEEDISPPAGSKVIRISEFPDMEDDYCIRHSKKELNILVKNREVGLWMCYQLISAIAEEDSRFVANDLLPPIISFSDQCRKFDFEYREPHFPPNLQEDYAPINGNHNLETAWGLWGHNLSKTINTPSPNIYALYNEKRNREQFCFSSSELQADVSDYIINMFGSNSKETARFMIMPNDNDIVCLCKKCTEAGNTTHNATPAVTLFIEKLAKRFPNYTFFTSAYRTTSTAPSHNLPTNTGVMFSTMALPKGIILNEENKEVQQFIQQLENWKSKTPLIYLWDYGSNFDDYLTPIPVLRNAQAQFRFFKKHGVKGIFLNGSGYNYSPFDDIKTYLFGALMKDTDVDLAKIRLSFFKKKYPSSADSLYAYYEAFGKEYQDKNVPFNMYGGMQDILKTYLNASKFATFYELLPTLINNAQGGEQNDLRKMHTALSFTRLQIAHTKGDKELGYAIKLGKTLHVRPEVKEWVNSLALYSNYPDMNSYKETDGNLNNYIAEWETIIATDSFENQLQDIPIQLLSKPDEGFEKTNALNDGIIGFKDDYHNGWYISSTDDLHISFPANELQDCSSICMRFLEMPKHGFTAPEKIEISVDNKIIKTLTVSDSKKDSGISIFSTSITLKDAQNITIKCYRKKQKRSIIACDEIQLLH